LYIGNKASWDSFGQINSFSIYNRALSDTEILELYKNPFNLQTDGSLHNRIDTNDLPGWTKVFEGLCTQVMHEDTHDGEMYDYFGESVLFNEMLVRAVY
jgi:hypothetical protein